MSENPSQELNISGGQLSNVQVGGQAGRDLNANQVQDISQGELEKSLTSADVVKLIVQLEELFNSSDLPKKYKEKAIRHLENAKEVAQEDKPDKDFAAKSLQRATKVLKEAGATVDAGTSLWSKVQPIISRLLPWLGVAASFFA